MRATWERWSLHLILVVAALLAAHSTRAQTEGRSDAGRVQQRFEREAPPQPPTLPPLAAPQQPPGVSGPSGTFVLAAVDIEGATVYDPAALAPLYEPYLARRTDL